MLKHFFNFLVVTGTLPYRRFFQINTLAVIERIAHHCSQPEEYVQLQRVITRWRHRKLGELQYISIACAILLGAVIGTFSWNNVDQAYWLARAFWYISLVLSVLGILLAAQQVAVLNFLGEIPKSSYGPAAQDIVDRYLPLLVSGARPIADSTEAQSRHKNTSRCRPNWKMVFIWQCPIMFMSYSACFFLLGLSMLVVTPLIRLQKCGWTGDATVAIVYLAALAIVGAVFVFCAFWVYHYLDMDVDSRPYHELSLKTPSPSTINKDKGADDENSVTPRVDNLTCDDNFTAQPVVHATGSHGVFSLDYSQSLMPRPEGFGH